MPRKTSTNPRRTPKRCRAKSDGGLVPKILEFLAMQRDVLADRRNSGGKLIDGHWVKFGKAGTLDVSGYLMLGGGGFYAVPFEIEAKSEKGKLRESQEKRIARLKELNVPHLVARELWEVQDFIRKLRRLPDPSDTHRTARRLGS